MDRATRICGRFLHHFLFSEETCEMKRATRFCGRLLPAVVFVALGVFIPSTVLAEIAFTGNVFPDPTTWTIADIGYVGNTSNGTLTVNSGSALSSYATAIGNGAGVLGVATVDGAGSTLTNNALNVGISGSGILNITNGGTVANNGQAFVGGNSGATGTVTVDGTNSTFNTQMSMFVGESGGDGTLNITNGGAINVGFQNMRSTVYISDSPGSTAVVTVDGAGSLLNGSYSVGNSGNGTLNVTNGGTIVGGGGILGSGDFGGSDGSIGTLNITNGGTVSGGCFLGQGAGSTGFATVAGTGSTFSGNVQVGVAGKGTLNIVGGGSVSNSFFTEIGVNTGSAGMVKVDGAGSALAGSWPVHVGYQGSGTLNVTGGGAVTATGVSIGNSQSLLAIDVGRGSSMNVGSGTVTNNGTVRVLAGAGVAAGNVYTPITAGTWSGTGTYQAVGGTWDTGSQQFTVSTVQTGTSGTPVSIDLASTQRMLITDSSTGWSVGASFLAKSTSTPLNFTATAMGSGTLGSLQAILGPGQPVLSAWDFLADAGFTPGDPAYLSFDVGSGYSIGGLEVWHFDGTDWTQFAANDLTYDGTYASFTVTGFSGYAVTVPEPGTLILLASGLVGALAYFWRKRQ
jgi:T5SS/PEP-CTERM-associated repeat protein